MSTLDAQTEAPVGNKAKPEASAKNYTEVATTPKETNGKTIPKVKRVVPPIASIGSWMRLASCPMPWEDEAAGDTHTIGIPEHKPLRSEVVTWGLGYHFPQGMLQAALGDTNGGGGGGDGIDGNSHSNNNDNDSTNGNGSGDRRRKGDTWLVERATRGACPPDADAAGNLLTSPRLEELGLMGVEVRYGFGSVVRRRPVPVEKSEWDADEEDNGADAMGEPEALPAVESEMNRNETEEMREKVSFWAKLRKIVDLKHLKLKKRVDG